MNTMSTISAMSKKMAKPPSWSAMGGGVSGQNSYSSGPIVNAVYALDANNLSFSLKYARTSLTFLPGELESTPGFLASKTIS